MTLFSIDDGGVLHLRQPPDYEDPADENGDNTYSFSLHVYDTNPPRGSRPAQTFFNVRVTVTNEPFEPLEIRGPSAVDYPENGTEPVYTYTLERLHATESVDEWVLSGADGGEFSISTGGVLTFNPPPPDYENPTDSAEENAYLVTITAYDGTQSKTEFIRVRVTNVNEPPEFDEGATADRNVDRSTGVNQIFGDPVTATDPDGDSLTYTLPDAATLPFSISEYTGQLSVSGTIDRNRASYPVAVIVTDNDPDNSEDDRIIVTVNVAGGGNNAPEFPTAAVSFSIDENTATVENVGAPVTATDDDTDDTLTYTLGGTDAGFFTIVDDSGQIQTKAGQAYDFETKPSYSVTVTVNDGNSGTATKAVTITLTNVEEEGTVTLSTNAPSARNPVTASVTDLDNGVTSVTWQWSRSSTAQGTYNNISGATSATYEPVDGDVTYFLKATASYTDDQGPNKRAEKATTSAVQTGTNRAPTFDDGPTTTRELAENTQAGQPIGAPATATDLDDNQLTYSLEGTDANSFQIVSGSGQIQTKPGVNYDFETKPRYSVTVRVVDDNQVTDTIDVTINVTNVDEAGTVTLSTYQPPARVEITATLSDLDGSVSDVTWKWAKTSNPNDLDNHPWTDIDSETSASYTPPDGDVGSYLRATASYTDPEGSGKKAHAATTSAVGAGANRAPDFGAANATRSFPENTAANTNIGNPVEADDPDTGNTLTYSLDTTGATLFDIDSASSQIKTKSGVTYDHETTPSYAVTVKADDGNSGTDTINVTITVTDVEEAGTVTLSMTQPSVRTAITATLTDPDGGVTGTTWKWASSSTAQGAYTDISGATSNTYTPVDGDMGNYLRATASYTDRRGAGKTADAVSENAVQAGANRPPTFSGPTTTREVAENPTAVTNVGDPVKASDTDSSDLAKAYSLEGTDATILSTLIVHGTGQIQD